MIEDRWNDEAAWWTMGGAEARRRLHPAAIVVLDSGVLQGEAILRRMDTAPRWTEVQMTDRLVTEGEDCTVLAYRATARTGDGVTRQALCSSTWVRQDGGWRLIQHQQTAPDGGGDRRAHDTPGNYAVDHGAAGEAVLDGAEALNGFEDDNVAARAQPGMEDDEMAGQDATGGDAVPESDEPMAAAIGEDERDDDLEEDLDEEEADDDDDDRDDADLDLDGDGLISADELIAERERFSSDDLDPADRPGADGRSYDEIGYDQAVDGPGARALADEDDDAVAVEIADDLFGTPDELADADLDDDEADDLDDDDADLDEAADDDLDDNLGDDADAGTGNRPATGRR